MIAESRNPRDSYYSSLLDDYASGSSRAESPVGSPSWNHGISTSHKRRPSLNIVQPRNSVGGLRRQPSYDFPSPSNSSILSWTGSQRVTSPFASSSSYRDSQGIPPSPGYIFSHYYHNSGDLRDSFGSSISSTALRNQLSRNDSKDIHEDNSLTIPPELGRVNPRHSPSPSGSSVGEDHSSFSSCDDDVSTASIGRKRSISAHTSSSSLRVSHQNGQSARDPDRDQYGFRKSYQWITQKEYKEFESKYSRIQQRRKIKWDQLLEKNGGNLPSESRRLRRYIRKGVPPALRGRVWFHYSGAAAKMRDHPDLYEKLLQKFKDSRTENEYVEVIERDLHRTFPENIKFKSTVILEDDTSPAISTDNVPIIQALRRVLVAFSLYSPNIGYCQSLNYIAGLLLLFMEEEQAFWTLVTIIHEYLPENMYDMTMEGSNVDQAVLMKFIMDKMPNIWKKINAGFGADGSMPTITLVTNHWFLTLYINILPIETMLRVWDCFFYEGNKVLFRVALTIFKINEEKILKIDDPMEVFVTVQNMPKRLIDCHKLMEACYSRRKLDISSKDIERQREIFRERLKHRVESMLFKS